MTNITVKTWISLTVACATLVMAILFRPQTGKGRLSLLDVKGIAEANGFFAIANANELENEDAQFHKMIISRRALSEKELESLVMADLEHPLWRDCICVMRMRHAERVRHAEPAPDDIVGDLLLFGDKEIIRTMKIHLASIERPN